MPDLHFLSPAAEAGDGLEDRGEDEIHHAADQACHDHEDDGGDEGHEALHVFGHFAVVAFGGAAQGGVDFAGLFAHSNHVDKQGRKGPDACESFGEGATITDLGDNGIEVFAHDQIACGIAGEFERTQQRQSVADEVGHGFEKLHVEAAGDEFSEKRHAQLHAIPGEAVLGIVFPGFEKDRASDEHQGDDMPPLLKEIGARDHDLCTERDLGARGALDQRGELGNERGDQQDRDADARKHKESGVDEGENELGLQFLDRLEIMRLAAENGIERAGGFTCGGEAAIELIEARAGAAQGVGEVHAIAHILAQTGGDGFEVAELLAIFHREQGGLELEAAA